jgi:UDP-2-acetamido-3-amino-2,3-dideoxy-glucuronate N-acetyltransferase
MTNHDPISNTERDLMPSYFAHESSYIDDGAVIGDGTRIWHFCHVLPGAVIGERCNLGQNVVVMGGTTLGNNVKVQNNVSIYEGVVLEDDVFCGPSCVFTNVTNPRSHVSRKSEYRRTLVRRGSSIGANATIVCGVTLGEYCFIGAGAVVRSDVPAYALMVGVPARRVGWMCQCGVRLQLQDGRASCAACGAAYQEREGVLQRIDRPRSAG